MLYIHIHIYIINENLDTQMYELAKHSLCMYKDIGMDMEIYSHIHLHTHVHKAMYIFSNSKSIHHLISETGVFFVPKSLYF